MPACFTFQDCGIPADTTHADPCRILMSRRLFPQDWWSKNMPGAAFGADGFMEMLEMYTGDNEAEVYAKM